MGKSIDTLVEDIYAVIEQKGGWNEVLSESLGMAVRDASSRRLLPAGEEHRGGLRMSNLGTPCQRKLWYSVNQSDAAEPLSPSTRFKFFYGDLLEEVLLHLAQAAGHDVRGSQDELEIGGIKGHRDCVIDGITVDVKSASSFSFAKFQSNGLRSEDPFGYLSQLSSYVYAGRDNPDVPTDPNVGAFLVVDKVNGNICLDMYDLSDLILTKELEVEALKNMAASDTPPSRSFVDTEETYYRKPTGNSKLGVQCSYCAFKETCWPGLRTFIKGGKPVFYTKVETLPKKAVEVTDGTLL